MRWRNPGFIVSSIQGMKLPRKSGALTLGLVSAATAVLLLWALQQDPGAPWRRLSDGTTVRVAGVTYGTQHRITEGVVWQQLLQPLLPVRSPIRMRVPPAKIPIYRQGVLSLTTPPSSVQGYFGAWRSEWETPAPELLIWLRHRATTRQWATPYFDVEDEHGCRFPATNLWLRSYPEAGTLDVVQLDAFPRRGSPFHLVPRNPAVRLDPPAGLTVRAPDLGKPHDWTPEVTPQTRSHGDLSFRFLGWIGGRLNPIAHFEVRRNGGLTRAWEPITVTASDATGNSVTTTRELEPQPDPTRIIFQGLCREEPAWKLRVEFAPALPPLPRANPPAPDWSPAPKAPPSWTWKTRIPAPGSGRQFIRGTRLTRPELQLEVVSAAQKGAFSDNERDKRPLRCPSVLVRMSGTREPVRLTLVRVTDERGRSAVPQWQEKPLLLQADPFRPRPSHLFRPVTEERTFVLPDLPGARTLELEFVAHRVVPVDFLVQPPER